MVLINQKQVRISVLNDKRNILKEINALFIVHVCVDIFENTLYIVHVYIDVCMYVCVY